MLTQSEREWLEHRDAMQFMTGTYIADFAEFPLWNNGKDWQEAADFEGRVAAKLASVYQHVNDYFINLPCDACPCEKNCNLDCQDSILRWAQLAVEEEMDADTE